ncbi:MAG TPA: hypothetical protein VIT44_00260 [Cyclobacteriaceae bacterium]
MKRSTQLLTLLLIGFSYAAVAQRSSIKVIAELPLHFGIGYEGQVAKHFSIGGSVGVMTAPNSTLILDYMRFVGTDELVVLILEDAFKLGIVGELNFNYNFGRNYVGVFGQYIGVQAGDASMAVVEDYFNTTQQEYPFRPGKAGTSDKYVTVRTRLYQAGVLFGHRFPFKGSPFEIDLEMGLSANIGSKSRMYSENRDLEKLSARFDSTLKDFYHQYAFIPSIGVLFVYKLKANEN